MKKIIAIIMITLVTLTATGCTQAERVSYNLSLEADNFNIIRSLTVVNCLKGEVLFQMIGKLSIKVDTAESQLEVTVQNEDGSFSKHFVGLSDNVTYIIEDVEDGTNVSNYHYEINFNPNLWLPVTPDYID